jgi:hypothetical protein
MKLTLDLDNVLANFVDTWHIWMLREGITTEHLDTNDVKGYDWHKKKFGVEVNKFFINDTFDCYDMIRPYEGAKDFLRYCMLNFEDVEILSHTCTERSSKAKKKFCQLHLDFDNIKFADSKTDKYLQTEGRVLIDDYPAQVIKHISNNEEFGIVYNHNNSLGWCKLD